MNTLEKFDTEIGYWNTSRPNLADTKDDRQIHHMYF